MSLYAFARTVDELGDTATGDRLAKLDAIDAQLDLVATGEPTDPVVRDLAAVLRAHQIDVDLPRRLVQANRQDQTVLRYASFADLLGYCRLSADPVGRMVLALVGADTAENVALSDRICSALQVVEHLQDVAEDLAAGRVYLPADDLAAAGCTEADLLLRPSPPRVRAVIALEAERARQLLTEGAPLVGRLSGRARLAVAGFVAGGRATVAALAVAGFAVTEPGPRPRRSRLLREWVQLTVGGGA